MIAIFFFILQLSSAKDSKNAETTPKSTKDKDEIIEDEIIVKKPNQVVERITNATHLFDSYDEEKPTTTNQTVKEEKKNDEKSDIQKTESKSKKNDKIITEKPKTESKTKTKAEEKSEDKKSEPEKTPEKKTSKQEDKKTKPKSETKDEDDEEIEDTKPKQEKKTEKKDSKFITEKTKPKQENKDEDIDDEKDDKTQVTEKKDSKINTEKPKSKQEIKDDDDDEIEETKTEQEKVSEQKKEDKKTKVETVDTKTLPKLNPKTNKQTESKQQSKSKETTEKPQTTKKEQKTEKKQQTDDITDDISLQNQATEYQLPEFKLPAKWREKSTGIVYSFPRSQEEFDALPPKHQAAVSKIIERRRQEYEQLIMSNPHYKAAYEQLLRENQQQQEQQQNEEDEKQQQEDDYYNEQLLQYELQQQELYRRQQEALRQRQLEEKYYYDYGRQNANQRQLPPNTEIDGEGKLTCINGYFGNRPIDNKGCWTCSPACHFRADCINPGFCKCADGYTGDGVQECNAPTPFIVKAQDINGIISAHYIGVRKDFKVREAYCRFTSTLVINASRMVDDTVICIVPEGLKFSKIAISLDGTSWSEDAKLIRKLSDKQFYQLCIAIIVVAGVISVIIGTKMLSKNNSKDDEQPLMHSHPARLPVPEIPDDHHLDDV